MPAESIAKSSAPKTCSVKFCYVRVMGTTDLAKLLYFALRVCVAFAITCCFGPSCYSNTKHHHLNVEIPGGIAGAYNLIGVVVRAQRTDPQRFSGRMGARVRAHWRKSSQWFSLQRAHAELVLADADMLDLFRRFCYSGWDPDLNRRALLPPRLASLLGVQQARQARLGES